MKILLLGQITCGKGTLSENLNAKYGYIGVSIGQILRDETAKDTDEAKIILDYQQRGELVPNDITLKVLKNYLNNNSTNMKKIYSILSIYLTTIIANATIFYVVPNGAGNKDGTSWANAYGNIQTAIDAAASVATANAPAEVWIAGGTYYIATELSMKNNAVKFKKEEVN